MNDKLQMVTCRQFGFSNGAKLNRVLVDALTASMPVCELCTRIDKELDRTAEGAEFVESPSFPGMNVQKMDAHFKSHWKDAYELVDLARRPGAKV